MPRKQKDDIDVQVEAIRHALRVFGDMAGYPVPDEIVEEPDPEETRMLSDILDALNEEMIMRSKMILTEPISYDSPDEHTIRCPRCGEADGTAHRDSGYP